MKITLCALAIAAACATPAFAADTVLRPYVGLDLGRSDIHLGASDFSRPGATFNDMATAVGGRIGLNLTPKFAVEFGHHDLGAYTLSYSGQDAEIKTSASTLMGVYTHDLKDLFPGHPLALKVKAGYANTLAKAMGDKSRHDGWAAGLGVSYKVNAVPASIEAGYTYLRNFADSGRTMDMFYLGVGHQF